MIRSMTGYGRAQGSFPGGQIQVEIRSVNNRYLDCGVRLPRGYGYLEDDIKTQVQRVVSRGKVDVYVSVDSAGVDNVTISVNGPLAEGYVRALRQMAEEYGIRDDTSAGLLARFSDVFVVEKQEQDEQETASAVSAVTAEALAAYDAMRRREGEALQADLLAKTDGILALVSSVEERYPAAVAAYQERLLAKMREVLDNTQIDDSRLVQEAALYADKTAVDEETVRLRSHVEQFRSMLAEGGVIGRKLDFLMQEMNREANTIGSKGSDAEQARTVVELKSELEKIREQIQNIE